MVVEHWKATRIYDRICDSFTGPFGTPLKVREISRGTEGVNNGVFKRAVCERGRGAANQLV